MRYGFWAPVLGGWLRNVPYCEPRLRASIKGDERANPAFIGVFVSGLLVFKV